MSYIGKIPANAVLTTADLADGIVTASKIEDGTVVAAEIASNAVTTAKINADAVTGAKIADNAINSEHYTDGSIDTAHIADVNVTQGKIANQAINEAKMQISNAPTNGYFLAAQSGNTGGLTWQEVSAGGITEADMHRLTTDFSGNVAPISSNWERCDENTFAKIGTGITNSSGTWSFGATGLYEVSFTLAANRADGAQYVRADIYATHNNSTYVLRSVGWSNIADHAGTIYTHCNTSIFLNVDNTTNVKFKLGVSSNTSNATTLGNTDENTTFVTAIRLGDAQ